MSSTTQEIEAKWQKRWEDSHAFCAEERSGQPKYYALVQFPYPSGQGLHMGHCSVYTIGDIVARHKRQQGFSVLHPIGWDAFGLPTENYAIEKGVHPRKVTIENIANFKRLMKTMGWSYDWQREIDTTSPEYFKWTQWIWKKLYEKGLCYKSEMPINWCDFCKVGVAHEEVTAAGLHERCDNPVRRRVMNQWMFRITDYAESLLKGLDELPDWPEMSILSQRNWIGRSRGAEVHFQIQAHDEKLTVFTTRPDTLFGATYMVLSPEHPLVDKITTADQKDQVQAYQEQAARKSDMDRTELSKEKTGVFTGAMATNPVNGEAIPIWIADYVLISYGTGAIMAVPGHDSRDFEFAKVFDLPIKRVLHAEGEDPNAPLNEAYTAAGILCHSSYEDLTLDGLGKDEAINRTIDWLMAKDLGKEAINYKLRDWVFARQRYWGEPFPLLIKEDASVELMADQDLPLELPDVESYQPTDTGESPLATVSDWINTSEGQRESDTMPNWAGSSWYWLRFMDPHNEDSFAAMNKQQYWGQVDLYVGGTEHLVLHDLYARFWNHALHDMGLVAVREPFKALLHQGMVLGNDGKKMSKSKGNGKTPDEVLDQFGTDVLRLHLTFLGPPEANKLWNDDGLTAMRRFLEKLRGLCERSEDQALSKSVETLMHRTIMGVDKDHQHFGHNTIIAKLMEMSNALQKEEVVPREAMKNLLIMLSPIAPHFCDEMGETLGFDVWISQMPFPEYDESKTIADEAEIVLQVNGKVREHMTVPRDIDRQGLEELARNSERVKKFTEGLDVKKIIAVPGKLVNVVAR